MRLTKRLLAPPSACRCVFPKPDNEDDELPIGGDENLPLG